MENTTVHYADTVIVTVTVTERCVSKFQTQMNGFVQCMEDMKPIHDSHNWNNGFAYVIWNNDQAVKT